MSYYVYIIQSSSTGHLYKGSTTDVLNRVAAHNAGLSQFTKSGIPWKLVYVREFESKSEALKEEFRLKKCNRKYLNWIISQPLNELNSRNQH